MYGEEEERENKVFCREEQKKKKVLWELKNKILREKKFLKYIYKTCYVKILNLSFDIEQLKLEKKLGFM